MVGPGKDGQVDRHHFVAHQLVDECVGLNQHIGGHGVKPIHESAELGRGHSLGQVRGAAYVHKKQRQVHFRTTRVRAADIKSEVAEARVSVVLAPPY